MPRAAITELSLPKGWLLNDIRKCTKRMERAMSHEDDDLIGCEMCGKSFDVERMTSMEGGWICEGCLSEWKSEFDTCNHDWETTPHYDDYGDEGRVCRRCSGFVRVEDLPDFVAIWAS
jgi:predicted amidophosphoribosyltransferase